MRSSRNSGLMTAAAMAVLASAAYAGPGPMPTLRSAGSGNNRRPTPPKRDTALQREIADHNAEMEARKAAKRDRKRAR